MLIVFGLLSASSLYSQDSVKCFNIEEQKRILTKFIQLDRCDSVHVQDSIQIEAYKKINLNLTNENTHLKKKVRNKNRLIKWGWIPPLFAGIVIGVRAKN